MTESALVISLDTDAEASLAEATSAVRRGACIVLPTDTVYGIGANAFDAAAVQGLLDAKERGRDMPPPVLVAEPSMLRAVADDVPQPAAELAKAFWPGPLTLILKAQPKGGMDLGETRGTVAVRVPDHDGARALLRRTGPLAVSSANLSGQPAALSCPEAVGQLGDRVAVYLDGGRVVGAVASTIVDFVAEPEGRIVREGALSLGDLQAVVPGIRPLEEPVPTPVAEAGSEPEADADADADVADATTEAPGSAPGDES